MCTNSRLAAEYTLAQSPTVGFLQRQLAQHHNLLLDHYEFNYCMYITVLYAMLFYEILLLILKQKKSSKICSLQ